MTIKTKDESAPITFFSQLNENGIFSERAGWLAILRLSFVLVNDDNVLKWLRPASNQFRMYWDNNSKKYEPDFVVETVDAIYMVETKVKNFTEKYRPLSIF